jgi:DegV family protein with EDD domain
MKISYLDGKRLQTALAAGAAGVASAQAHLNRINVFPIADGDTGLNLSATLRGVLEGLPDCPSKDLSETARKVADFALLSAQGNSGTILAHFLHGLAQELRGYRRIQLRPLTAALKRAARYPYGALHEPREGTILTVIKDWAERMEAVAENNDDILEAFSQALDEARAAVARTPTQLDILAAAGVVDAGGQGFLFFLEAILSYIKLGVHSPVKWIAAHPLEAVFQSEIAHSDEAFNYCTECVVESSEIALHSLRQGLISLGNSLLVAGSSTVVRIHIHTNAPGAVFNLAGTYGVVSREKAEDLRPQLATKKNSARRIAIVTDSSCDLIEDEVLKVVDIRVVPAQIRFGNETFIDRITMTSEDFYKKLATCTLHPTTSLPVPAEFRRAYEHLIAHDRSILSIHVSRALSGTIQGAEMVKYLMGCSSIRIIDSKNVAFGLGIIVREISKLIEAGNDIDDIERLAKGIVDRTKLFVTLETIEHMVRGGRIGRLTSELARDFNLVPVLSLVDGKLEKIALARKPDQFERLYAAFTVEAKRCRAYRFAIGHANAPDRARQVARRIQEEFNCQDLAVTGVAPTVGAHLGPGALGIAFLGRDA